MFGPRQRIQEDEYLERLWQMQEEARSDVGALADSLETGFDPQVLRGLESQGAVRLSEDGRRVELTETGKPRARHVIRAHRLGERLIHDAFGGDFEQGACEFEHVVTPELVDAICTLLGHPRDCPHGLPIPDGECCRKADKVVTSPAVALTDLDVGQSGRVVYVRCSDDSVMHKIDGLHIRPGTTLRVHQKYPTFVIECEGAAIALGEEIARCICVWRARAADLPSPVAAGPGEPPRRGWRTLFRRSPR